MTAVRLWHGATTTATKDLTLASMVRHRGNLQTGHMRSKVRAKLTYKRGQVGEHVNALAGQNTEFTQ